MNSTPYASPYDVAPAILSVTTPVVEPGPELDRARTLVLQHNRASLGLLRSRLRIGPKRANELLGQLQREGSVSLATVNGAYMVRARNK